MNLICKKHGYCKNAGKISYCYSVKYDRCDKFKKKPGAIEAEYPDLTLHAIEREGKTYMCIKTEAGYYSPIHCKYVQEK